MMRALGLAITGIALASVTACGAHAAAPPRQSSQRPAATAVPAIPTASPPPAGIYSIAFANADMGWAAGLRCTIVACTVELSVTADGGVTWSNPRAVGSVAQPAGGWHGVSASVRFDGSNGWVFGSGGVFASHDGGSTWQQVVKTDVLALEPYASTVWAVTGCDDTCTTSLLSSPVDSDAWTPAAVQPPPGFVTSHDASQPGVVLERSPRDVAFIAEGTPQMAQSLYTTRDDGASWHQLASPCSDISSLRSLDGLHVWVLCSQPCCTGNYVKAVYTSEDGGDTWREEAAAGLNSSGSIPFYGSATSLVVTGPSTADFAAFGTAGIWRTADGGRTWKPAYGDMCTEGGSAVQQLWFVDSQHGWAVLNSTVAPVCPVLLRTVDGGVTWTPLSPPSF